MRNTKIPAVFFLALSLSSWIAKANSPLASEPTAQPTNLVFPMVNSYSVTLSFTAPGDLPDGYLVIRSIDAAPTAGPVDGVTYSLNAALGNGHVVYAGNALSVVDVLYSNGEIAFYTIYAYNGTSGDINYLTLNPLSGSQQSGGSSGYFYSRASGNWDDLSTWSIVSHTGPPADGTPGGTGADVYIADGHYINMTKDVDITPMRLFVGQGAVLNANGFTMSMSGSLWNYGSILNGGKLRSYFGDFQIQSYYELPVFRQLEIENVGWSDGVRLFTDIVFKQGVKIVDGMGKLVPNGFTVYPCVPPSVQPSDVTVTERSGDYATVQWTKGNGNRSLVIVRNAATTQRAPKPGVAYSLGSQTGTGNFVVYRGQGSSVTVTGLSPSQEYQFDVYTFNNTGNCYNVSTLPKVEVISPADGKTQSNINLQVRARMIAGYSGRPYWLQYSIDLCPSEDFTTGVINQTGDGPIQYFTGLQYNTKYFTRVKTNVSAKYSKITTFTTAPAHQFTYMVSPTNLAMINSVTPTVVSSPVSGAETYTIELNTAADFSGVSRVQSGGRSQKFNGLSRGTTYYVRIKTNLDDVWGVTRSFSINAPAPLTMTMPPARESATAVATSAEELFAVRVYPNPFRKGFAVYVNTPVQQPIELSLMDVTGRETAKVEGFTNTVIEMNEQSSKAAGVYLLRVSNGHFIKMVRVIKEE